MSSAIPLHNMPERGGFSLVEIAMALGIFAFAIIAILGLLTTTITSDKTAEKDTVLAQMAKNTSARLRSQTFRSLATNTAYADQAVDFYYDVSGVLARGTNGNPVTTKTDASVFECVVTRNPSPSTNLYYLELDFRWPAGVAATNQESRTVTTSMANYD